jgi:hypothetical protein
LDIVLILVRLVLRSKVSAVTYDRRARMLLSLSTALQKHALWDDPAETRIASSVDLEELVL